MSTLRILIVGAGIAGLATARALHRAGIAVGVVERQPRWQHPGAGMYLPGNATRALRALGLDAAVRSRAVEITCQRVRDHRGRLLFEVDLARLWGGVGPCVALPRAELHEALHAGADSTPIRMGVTITALSQQAGRVAVTFSDRTSATYDLVIGADGIDSTVRRLAFDDAPAPRPVGQVGWRFVAPCPPEVTTWSVLMGRRAAFLTLPIGSGRVYCYGDVFASPDTVIPVAAAPQRLPALFAAFAEPASAGRPAIPEALARFEARRRPRTNWVRAQTHRPDHTRYLQPAIRDAALRLLGRRIFHSHYQPLTATI